MDKKNRENYRVEDLITDESFANYHFHLNKTDEIFWKERIAKHPEKIALVKKAEEIIQTLSITISESEYQEELSKITAAINKKTHDSTVFSLLNWYKRSLFSGKKRRSVIYLAPIILILIAAGYLLSHYFQKSSQLSNTINAGNLSLIFTLSDSTVVTLAPHSILRYPLHFKDKERNVYLEGDAGFNVKRNGEAPFKVYVEDMVTTVLGTIFNIKKSGDTALIVELLKGKLNVEIINNNVESPQSILLVPDESAIYVRNKHHFYKKSLIPEINLSFHQNDFEEIASQIKKVFGITVINQSNKSNWRFTGEFKNISVNEIIESITHVEKLSYEVKGDTILIK